MARNKPRSCRLKEIWQKSNGICAHCGRPASNKCRTVDHYIPKSKGGGFDRRNLMPLCIACNKARGNEKVDPTVFYSFASKSAIEKCLQYENELAVARISMNGDLY